MGLVPDGADKVGVSTFHAFGLKFLFRNREAVERLAGLRQGFAVFARGDRRLGDAMERAWKLGCRFDGWSDQFRYDLWLQAFKDCGIDPDFYATRERPLTEVFPWDHLDCGVTKQFLWREKEKSERAETTRDCRAGCNGCGLQRWKGVCAYANAGSV